MKECLLVTGVHREELAFGDKVTRHFAVPGIEILRIPKGISHSRRDNQQQFYFRKEHQEIYLQLHSLVKGHYRMLIDLHAGIDDQPCPAEVYSGNTDFLERLAILVDTSPAKPRPRLIQILKHTDSNASMARTGVIDAVATSFIPEQVWNNKYYTYTGLEIYLTNQNTGVSRDWHYARKLIETIYSTSNQSTLPVK